MEMLKYGRFIVVIVKEGINYSFILWKISIIEIIGWYLTKVVVSFVLIVRNMRNVSIN